MKNPKVTVSAKVKVEHLAAIALYLDESGARPRSRSDLIQSCLSLLHEILIANDKIEPIESFGAAVQILDSMGFGFNYGSQGHKEIAQGLTIEAIEHESGVATKLSELAHDEEELEKFAQTLQQKLRGE